jgi:hypothetical protein
MDRLVCTTRRLTRTASQLSCQPIPRTDQHFRSSRPIVRVFLHVQISPTLDALRQGTACRSASQPRSYYRFCLFQKLEVMLRMFIMLVEPVGDRRHVTRRFADHPLHDILILSFCINCSHTDPSYRQPLLRAIAGGAMCLDRGFLPRFWGFSTREQQANQFFLPWHKRCSPLERQRLLPFW